MFGKGKGRFFDDINNSPDLWDTLYAHNIASYFKVTLEIGFLLNQADSHIAALAYYEEVLEYARKMYKKYKDGLFLVSALNGMGFSSFSLSRFPSAFSYFFEAYHLVEECGPSFDKAYFLIQQAGCLMRMNKDIEAIDKLNIAMSTLQFGLQSKLQTNLTWPVSSTDFASVVKSDVELQKLWFMFTEDVTELAYKESVELRV